MCGEPIASTGARGPRRSICDKPACRHTARAEDYLAAAERELEAAGELVVADQVRKILEAFGRLAAIARGLRGDE